MNRFFAFLTDWPLLVYNFVLLLAAPIVLPLKAWRYWKKGWKREYDLRRWAIPEPHSLSQTKSTFEERTPDTPHVVILATGWGEMRLAALLDARLKSENPAVRTTWVLRDGEAARAAQNEYPEQMVSFLPFDFLFPVLMWLRRLQPDSVVFVEKFWFPNLVRGCKNWGAKLVVVNARTRAHDSARYRVLEPFHRWVSSSFSQFVFQSEEDRQRASRVLAPHTKVSAPGNLKFSLRPLPNRDKEEELARWLTAESTFLLAAGSLEEGDLGFVLDAFEEVREQFPCRLLVAPRRLHHVADMKEELRARGHEVSLRSEESTYGGTSESTFDGENSREKTVFLLDTMGELAAAYRFAQAAFIGGTLGRGAGHNVVEPLVFGVPVSYGPNRGFFESVQRACEAAGVGFRVGSAKELAAHWLQVLESEPLRAQIRTYSSHLLEAQTQALAANVDAILESLEK